MTKAYRKPTSELRVLVAGHLPPPMGGIGTYCQQLLGSSLRERVDLFFVQTSSQNRNLAVSGVASAANITSAIKDIGRFAKAVFTHHPQVTHICTASGLSFLKHSVCILIAYVSGSRVLLHPHCSFSEIYTSRPAWWKGFFRGIIGLTSGVITLSREWEQLGPLVPGRPIYTLPNAVDVAQYSRIAEEHFSGAPNDGPLNVLYLGYLGKAKGSYELIEAAQMLLSQYKDVQFDLVGNELTPGEWESLYKLVPNEAPKNGIQLHPAAYGQDKLAFLGRASLFVYPSYHEGMPMAVLEAMACGLPVVATRVGGLPELVQEGQNGFLVDPGSAEQLAEALLRLITDAALASRMGRCSFQVVAERYDLEKHVQQLEQIYRLASAGKQGDR